MLSIGAVHGGPETAGLLIGKFEKRLMCMVSEMRGDFKFGSAAALNVVFHIPGSILRNLDYEGLRDGTFSRKEKFLMIQVAVPKEIVESCDKEEIFRFLFDSLREANRIGALYFKKKKVEYSQPKFLGLVDAVEEKFRQTMQNHDDK